MLSHYHCCVLQRRKQRRWEGKCVQGHTDGGRAACLGRPGVCLQPAPNLGSRITWPGPSPLCSTFCLPGCPGLLCASSVARCSDQPLAATAEAHEGLPEPEQSRSAMETALLAPGFLLPVLLRGCTGPSGSASPGCSVCSGPEPDTWSSLTGAISTPKPRHTRLRPDKARKTSGAGLLLPSSCTASSSWSVNLILLPKQFDGPVELSVRFHRRTLRLPPFPRMLIKTTTQRTHHK
ncbi:hypothetical protein HJG60_008066 [Phyllostomus discolor]|uniref:Uncharacterized protein n=1 Tax=Phyllostomus discolor TaxID=89673 RepID=A0A834EVV1_9CHIR|nr:hypothetical protein HJG60_008066 [Phyllostomus discolor]